MPAYPLFKRLTWPLFPLTCGVASHCGAEDPRNYAKHARLQVSRLLCSTFTVNSGFIAHRTTGQGF